MASRRLAPTGQQLLSTDLGSPLHILVGRLMARVDTLTTEVTWLRSEVGALWAKPRATPSPGHRSRRSR